MEPRTPNRLNGVAKFCRGVVGNARLSGAGTLTPVALDDSAGGASTCPPGLAHTREARFWRGVACDARLLVAGTLTSIALDDSAGGASTSPPGLAHTHEVRALLAAPTKSQATPQLFVEHTFFSRIHIVRRASSLVELRRRFTAEAHRTQR